MSDWAQHYVRHLKRVYDIFYSVCII